MKKTQICWDAPSGPVDLCSYSLFFCMYLPLLSLSLCLYPCTFPLSSLSLLMFVFFAVFFTSPPFVLLFLLPLSFSPLVLLPVFPLIFVSAAVRCCNLGAVSSGQSYPSTQYESGLQQGGQQGEQPGHQPRTLLHTPWWVAVVDGILRRGYW